MRGTYHIGLRVKFLVVCTAAVRGGACKMHKTRGLLGLAIVLQLLARRNVHTAKTRTREVVPKNS